MSSSAVVKFLLANVKPALEIGAASVVVVGALKDTDAGSRVQAFFRGAFADVAPGAAPAGAPSGTPPLLPPPVGGAPVKIGCACQHPAGVGEGPAVPAGVRLACPKCPPVVAGAGETVQVSRCKAHEAELVRQADALDTFYVGWATDAMGVDPAIGYADCGPKPQQTDKQYRTFWGNLDEATYYPALDKWKDCTAKAKAGDVAARAKTKTALKKGEHDAYFKARQKDASVTQFALAAQKKKYEDQAAALVQQQQQAQSAADKAALQKQIDQLNMQAADTAKLQAATQAAARDADHQRQIDQLTKEVSDAAKKPGGMDDMMKMAMVAKMFPGQPGTAASAAVAAPMMPSMARDGGGGGGAPPVNVNVNIPAQDGGGFVDPNLADDGWGTLDGAHDEPIDPELAAAFGLSGVQTIGEARELYALRQEFGTADPEAFAELAAAYSGAVAGIGGCNSCGPGFPGA